MFIDMKKMLLNAVCSLCFILVVDSALGLDYPEPKFAPEQAISIAEKYLAEEKKINLDYYYLSSISFNYYSRYGDFKVESDGRWDLSYECKEPGLGCHFSVWFTDTDKPKFTFFPGR